MSNKIHQQLKQLAKEILEMEEVPEREEIDEFFDTYDTNQDGRVTFEEILASDAELRTETGAES